MDKQIKIVVVDDHTLFRNGLVQLIHHLGDNYEVIRTFGNGLEFIEALEKGLVIDLALIDIGMPIMDGYETGALLQEKFPDVKYITVTMNDAEESLVRMLKLGARGFLNKDVEPKALKASIDSVMDKGYHYTEELTGRLISILRLEDGKTDLDLSENELTFLKLACSDEPYKSIADKMGLSIKTIDGYRASLFEKLDVKSRVGLVIYAIKNKLISL